MRFLGARDRAACQSRTREMATFLFWNINRNNVIDEIVTVCHDNSVDILVLAESYIPDESLLLALNKGKTRKYLAPFNPSDYLSFFIRYPEDSYKLISDEHRVAIRHILPPIGQDILLIAVHLPSKMHMTEADQLLQATRLSKTIKEAEKLIGHTNSLILGDLNMNPFEFGVVAADGLHGVMDKQIALKGNRTVQGISQPFFYNPMWSLIGDASPGPSGTYYYASGNVSYFWNTFDQVLLRPSLLKYYSDENLKVIDAIGHRKLVRSGRIDTKFSDHLPIVITLDLEKEDGYDS